MLLLVILCLVAPALAQIQHVDFPDGPYTVHFIFNLATYTTDYVVFARYDPPDVYFITVRPDSTFSSPVTCRAQSQQRVVWGPIGCSDPANPALATQSANCISSQSTRDERLALLRRVWSISKETNRCFILGGAGDPRLCTGPVRLAIQGQDSFLPLVNVTDRTILQSQMVFIDALTDPLAMMPTVVEVDILMPALVVTTTGDCSAFDGTYVPYNRQRYPSYLTDVWQTFIKTGCTAACLKISFRQWEGLSFIITFDDTDPEVPAYISDAVDVTFVGVWESWIDVLQLGQAYLFNGSDCQAVFGIESAPAAWQLTGPYPPTANNYSWNINPRRFYNTRVCNYAIGRLGHDLEEVFPFTAEGSKRGGDPLYVDPETGFPLGVDADNVDYRFDCSEFYPLNESFWDFGLELASGTRTLINRMAVDQEMCFAPFPLPQLIIENKNPDERYVQCQKLGGYVYGSATTMCGRPITQIDCPLNYYYFDQRCFWKFNPTTDQRFAVSSGDADASCKLVNPLLAALVQIDIYTQQWLLDWYLNIKRDVSTYALYRIPQFNSPGCQIFNSSSGEIAYDQSCFNTLDGDLYVFPICYYPITISQLEPKYKDQQISLKGALLRAKGQVGPRPNGKEAVCNCFTGWTGKNCEVATCPLEDLLLNSTDTTTDTLFFKKCYLNKQGGCYERNPRVCQCMTPFAPDASLLDSLPLLKQFQDFPCMCPAAPQKLNPFFTINSTQYRIPFSGQRIPCSGDQNGNCLIAGNSSNAIGVCECVQRYNILENLLEDAFDGRACSCSRPIQPYGGLSKNGPIITDLCNNHGYCAPFGESVADPVGYIYLVNQSIPGCQCDNGWGGAACTCPTPFNYLAGKPTLTVQQNGVIYYYKDIGSKQLISWVRSNCTLAGEIALSNLVGGGAAANVSALDCTFDEYLQLFACPADEAYQFVVINSGSASIYCTAEAYSIMYNYCGENNTVNAFAGRFYQLGSYRDSYKYQLQQPFTTASYGCTESGCMCNADYGGRLCAARVSSYRLEQSFIDNILTPVWTKEFCGETTLLPTLLNPVGSRGRIIENECVCNPISAVDPSGRRGAVQNRFSASACQCVVAQDPLDQVLKTCAGHGECEEPSFIYGWCQVDLDTYSQDSLSRPFNAVVDPAGQTFQLTAVVDSFFYGYSTDAVPTPAPVPVVSPTRFPTNNPVLNPTTNSPTAKPTTKTPTTSPTAPTTNKPTSNPTTGTPTTGKPTTAAPTPAALKLYRAQYTSPGSLGSRGTTTTTCASSSYRPSGCSQTPMMVSYSAGDSIAGLQATYGFSASSVVQGPTGTQIADSWTALMAGTSLSASLFDAGVLPAAVSWWSGKTTSSNNCGGWTDFTVFGNAYTGISTSTGTTWANSAGTTACSNYLYQVCLCVP
jgi:hypothetical protein